MKKRKRKKSSPIKPFPSLGKDLPVALSIFIFAFALRLINLLSFPMFNDEALLLGWSKMVSENPAENLTLSIRADGYPPLTTWIYAIIFKFFSNPLFAGRLVSVFAGALSAVGVYLIGQLLYSKRVGILAAISYIFVPMTFFIDRYAYHDSLITFFAVYTFLFTLLILKGNAKNKPLYFLGLGLSLGIGVLSKTAAFLILIIPPLAWFLLKSEDSSAKKSLKILTFSYAFPALSYSWLFSDPYSWIIFKKGRDLSMSYGEILAFPFAQWKTNFLLIFINFWYYLTPTLLMLFFYAFYKLAIKREKNQLFLISFSLVVLAFFLIVSKGRIHFKYLAFIFPFLLIFLAFYIEKIGTCLFIWIKENKKNISYTIKSEFVSGILLLMLLIPSLRFDYSLITNPYKAPFEPIDYELHLQAIFSGAKLEECAKFLRDLSQKRPILIILPHPDNAIIYWGLPLILEENPNLNFINFGTNFFYYLNGKKHCWNFSQVLNLPSKKKVRLLAVISEDKSEEWPEIFIESNPEAKLIKKFIRPGNKSSINIYEIPY